MHTLSEVLPKKLLKFCKNNPFTCLLVQVQMLIKIDMTPVLLKDMYESTAEYPPTVPFIGPSQ